MRYRFLLALLLLLSGTARAFATAPLYDISVAYREETQRLEGAETIFFTNDGREPLSEVYLFLYPNIYHEKSPALSASVLRRAYPVGFNPGGMEITSVVDAEGALPYGVDPNNNVLLKVLPRAPIPAGARFAFQVRFVATIPEKFGVFGYYRDLVTLQDGWHPYLPPLVDGKWDFRRPPTKSRFQVRLQMPDGFRLMSSAPFRQEADGTRMAEADGLRFFSLSIGKRLVSHEAQVDRVQLLLHAREVDRRSADRVLQTAREAVSFFSAHVSPPAPMQLQLATSHLYQDMIGIGEKLLYVHTGVFKVPPFLRRFHEMRIARGTFFLLWQALLPEEELWVLEGFADLTTEQFMRHQHKNPSDLERWLKPVAFIPLVDDVLYSRDIPSRHVYFKEAAAPLINEEILLFNQTRPGGITIFSKLKNLLGAKMVHQAVSVYRARLATRPSFREVLFEVSGRDLRWFFEQWLVSNPALDFRIEKVDGRKTEEGYETTLLIRKQGEGIEPLEIQFQEKNGASTTLLWEGEDAQHEAVVITPSPVRVVELDPNRESSDPDRSNNRTPRRWKVLLNRFGLGGYNLNTNELTYKAGLLFQPVYDKRLGIRIDFTHTEEGDAAGITYSRLLRNNHRFETGLLYQGPQTAEDQPPEEKVGVLRLGYAMSYPDIPILSDGIRRLMDRHPSLGLSFTYEQGLTRNNTDRLFTVNMDLRKRISFSNYHEIALRLFVGESFGHLFPNSRFFLGGDDGMRGFTPLAFEGDNMGLFSAEYRFPLFYETDRNLWGLVHTHTLQGALFADAGQVTDARNVFRFNDYRYDVGAGLRWYVDLFGAYPVTIRVDVAKPANTSSADEAGLQYYISGGQPF